jgi:hypothetical protein
VVNRRDGGLGGAVRARTTIDGPAAVAAELRGSSAPAGATIDLSRSGSPGKTARIANGAGSGIECI